MEDRSQPGKSTENKKPKTSDKFENTQNEEYRTSMNAAKKPNNQKYHMECCDQRNQQDNRSITAFLKQLIPKNFDTSDLMIVLLLLIISGDCKDDQNTALLTLVLYLFL